jgi:hypothetical protein
MAYLPGQNGGGTPSHPQVVYVQHQPTQGGGQSVERLTVPLLLFLSGVAFVGWASWFGTTSLANMQSDIKELSTMLVNYIERSNERVLRIERTLDARTAERWTKQDQALFCAQTEAIPGNKGWKCAESNGRAEFDAPSIWNGHLGPTAPVADITPDHPIGRWSTPKVRATP